MKAGIHHQYVALTCLTNATHKRSANAAMFHNQISVATLQSASVSPKCKIIEDLFGTRLFQSVCV